MEIDKYDSRPGSEGRLADTMPQSLEAEPRACPKIVVAALWALGLMLILAPGSPTRLGERHRMLNLALVCYALGGLGWILVAARPEVGRWFVVGSVVLLVFLADAWLRIPGLPVSLALVPALAAALISLRAAVAVATVSSVLLWPLSALTGTHAGTPSLALISIWAMLGAIYMVVRPVYQARIWSRAYFHHAKDLLGEARGRKAELEQALEDLADANQQLTRLNTLAHGLRQAAEDARRAKEEFVANVSHELRTPLNMIIGYSEMILQAPEAYGARTPAALLADLAVVHRNAEHLADLIDDVLDLSQIEAGQMTLTKEYVELREILDAAATAVRPLFESKGLRLETAVPGDLPLVYCDRIRIREVVLNLLSNAGRFTERGGVCVRANQENQGVVVCVEDTGPGISAASFGKLFEPFQQLDGSVPRRYGGTGLGLSISKRFVEAHGGRIWVDSEERVGTTVSFRLPVASTTPASSGSARWLMPDWEFLVRTRPRAGPTAVVRPRLLVCEAGGSLRRLLRRHLDGVEIVTTTTLDEALQELSEREYQTILVNGESVANVLLRLRSVLLPPSAVVIICSVPDSGEVAGEMGACDYLTKPVSREAFLTALDGLDLDGDTVLVVDDEPEALRLFRRMLASSNRGYRVLGAADGQEALRVLRERRPDAVLLDLVMPNMDGFQLLDEKNRDPELAGIPVVVISARDPTGQPIVSSALAITSQDGLSVARLISCIEMFSPVSSPAGPSPTVARAA